MSDIPLSTSTSKPGSSITVLSTNQFDNQSDFKDYILFSLYQVKEYHEFVFIDVPSSWGEAVLRLIDESIPSRVAFTWIHDCVQDWLTKQMIEWLLNGDITRQEESLLQPGVGTTLHLTTGPYSGSRKEPDFFFQVNDHILPTLAVECGWSESKGRIYDDMNLLLVGGNGSIRIVIIVKWAKLGGSRVSGTVELFMRDRNDMPILRQTETVFPRPTTTNRQRLEIRRGDLFGDALLAGRNQSDILCLDVERLRDHATRSLRFMNLVPA
ncbi:hypothetical protein DTO207G8_3159 [Paecilomyces variotii]|nr:hypothetical protein DTO207G8_3159 [Paecilomyces variotii]KAJ9263188.1 hypothetical protein DTO195F2_3166 [Paecilomyces variotii]KAJ9290482.1 hypothetical protein DTO021C3_2106 [Paecilomyces variotii]KAJ9373678.1 hypothetical protein DTO282E5_1462 [Paecilomyces variotii]KAJ9400670.1 hypothetical protein DTO282F9_2555 [Paecilomyces variotii]